MLNKEAIEASRQVKHTFFPYQLKSVIEEIGASNLIECLKKMLLIRNFETRAEVAYQQGKVGGFFHSYIGQEAIQTAMMLAIGGNNWFAASYRCHALAILLGAPINDLMAELYGRATGNALGRGGSMHFYTDRLLGGFGIVGGQIPIATGAAFSIKYQDIKDQIAVGVFGEGAVPQGSFHESLNMASLWDLPCLYLIENNQWGMGTAAMKAVCNKKIAEEQAPSYNMKGYTIDGMDFFACYAAFKHIHTEMLQTRRPVLVEAITERFKGHSISDPALYRGKEELKETMKKDPMIMMEEVLVKENICTAEEIKQWDKEAREAVLASMQYAEESPWPSPATLEEDVFAPESRN